MILRLRGVEAKLELARGDVVVGVVGADGAEAIASVTPEQLPVVPLDGELDAAALSALAAPSDLVLIDGRCRPPEGWLDRLRIAAGSGDEVGTASPLRDGAPVSPPRHPRAQLAGAHCLYLRREAIELAGPPAAGLEAFTAAAVAVGLAHVVADDLVVTAAAEPTPGSATDDAGLAALRRLDDEDESSPLHETLVRARAAERGLTVTIDGRSLNRAVGGTQRYALELILALERLTDIAVRVVLPPDPASEIVEALSERSRIDTISYEQAVAGVALTDVVHRPQQVFSEGDLNLLRLLGERLVITHQDLIAYRNPTYHPSLDDWETHRRVTRLALAAADRAIFFSQAALDDALAEQLVSSERSDVIGIAIDDPFPAPPRPSAQLAESDAFLVCLGADYAHKNRPFAIGLLAALREHHGWTGRLALAGGHVPHGSSAARECELLDADPALAGAVVDLGPVGEPERAWLLTHARAIVVPSVVEGFGLMPLEAAAAGVPCLFAARSSLREVVSQSLATLVPWDAGASADRCAELLGDGPARDGHVRRLRDDAARWRWEALVPDLVRSYEAALRSPYRAARVRVWQELERERYLAAVAAERDEMLAHLSGRAALARDDGFFTEAQLRGLWRVGSRPALARATMWPFGLLGELHRR